MVLNNHVGSGNQNQSNALKEMILARLRKLEIVLWEYLVGKNWEE